MSAQPDGNAEALPEHVSNLTGRQTKNPRRPCHLRGGRLEELAAIVSGALEDAGITATLSVGAAVTIYADNEYLSGDLDFVTNARIDAIEKVLVPLGFVRRSGARHLEHPETDLFVEFPPGPLAFGETTIGDEEGTLLQTAHGPLRIVTPTQLVMDRLAAYSQWHDGQSYDQAVMVVRRQPVEWSQLSAWAQREGVESDVVDALRRRASGG